MSLREEVIVRHLQDFGVPSRYRHTTLTDLTPLPNQLEAYQQAVRFVEYENLHDRYVSNARPIDEYPEDKSLIGRGLVFLGASSSGKSTLAAATLVTIYKRFGLPVRYISAANFIAESTEQMRVEDKIDSDSEGRWLEIQNRIRDVNEVPILMLDGLGQEHAAAGSEYASRSLENLLRTRFDNGRPTIVTSSLPLREWGKHYTDGLGCAARDMFEPCVVTAKSTVKV